LREAYRLNKPGLIEAAAAGELNIRILISLTNKAYNDHEDLSFAGLLENMSVLLAALKKNISA
jgi:hypothetical protein